MRRESPRSYPLIQKRYGGAIYEQIDAILETIKSALEQTPPELAADIVDRGILLTGGSALLKNLSLEEPTSGTPFGKIEGLLKGQINNLEIAYGQPQRFDLLLETVRQKGVSQKISVKAVENIAQIGGGQSPFLGLAGGFAYFFKEFPYKKIGVRASLENDVFRINGTVMEGGKEYLVKRGRFSGVDIVNQNPDNRISFRDMVKRMKRVTAGKGGPVVR